MENSSENFKKVSPHYIHRSEHSLDTGAEINFLTHYIYISLDTFHSVSQNINSYLDAWFTFLSSDAPDDILRLIEAYPEFKAYYHDIALFRKNPKELMNMYSEALLKMDRNTEIYMIEEMKQELADLQKEKDKMQKEKDKTIEEQAALIAQLQEQLAKAESK